jgi:hypothetical protein
MINMGDIAGMIISILRDRRRQHEKHCAQQFVSCLVPTPRELDQNMWICFNERKGDISLSMYIYMDTPPQVYIYRHTHPYVCLFLNMAKDRGPSKDFVLAFFFR